MEAELGFEKQVLYRKRKEGSTGSLEVSGALDKQQRHYKARLRLQ